MATKGTYGHVSSAYKKNFILRVGDKTIKAVGYEHHYFPNGVPANKHEYYARTPQMGKIDIKKNKGLTVNFWGTIVTDVPIDFGNDTEVTAKVLQTRMAV